MSETVVSRELMAMYGYPDSGESPQLRDVIYEEEPPIARVILNRPEKMNAIRRGAGELEIALALQLATANDAIKVVILKGNGRCFSSGHDMSGGRGADPASAPRNRRGWQHMEKNLFETSLMRAPWTCPKPVLAQVHGYCLGAATSIVLCCDVVICSDDASFGHPAQRQNGPHENAGIRVWSLGPQWAKRMLLTGDSVDAATAVRIGWATEMVPRDKLEATVEALAARMATVPLQALVMNKRFANRTLELAGYNNMFSAAADLILARRTDIEPDPEMGEFRRRNREQGLKSALQWRDVARYESQPDGQDEQNRE